MKFLNMSLLLWKGYYSTITFSRLQVTKVFVHILTQKFVSMLHFWFAMWGRMMKNYFLAGNFVVNDMHLWQKEEIASLSLGNSGGQAVLLFYVVWQCPMGRISDSVTRSIILKKNKKTTVCVISSFCEKKYLGQ